MTKASCKPYWREIRAAPACGRSTRRRARWYRSAGPWRWGAGPPELKCATEAAYEAGATDEEIVSVLLTVGPQIGLVGLVREAPRLALAIGYDVEDVVT